jgi:hypothetical protein
MSGRVTSDYGPLSISRARRARPGVDVADEAKKIVDWWVENTADFIARILPKVTKAGGTRPVS